MLIPYLRGEYCGEKGGKSEPRPERPTGIHEYLTSAEPRYVFRRRSGLDLVSICVDIVQSCEGRADLSKSVANGTRSGVKSRTTYGCEKSFVRAFGLFTEKDILCMTAHRWRDSVKAERRIVLITVCQRKGSRNWVGNFALPNKVRSIRL